jgi:RHS repeat-associated protein
MYDALPTLMMRSDACAFSAAPWHGRKYIGKERDSESGLDDFGARYFGSTLGRFQTPDAFYKDSHVGDPQSWNEYAYARNNPLRYVDPTGENATASTSLEPELAPGTSPLKNPGGWLIHLRALGPNSRGSASR